MNPVKVTWPLVGLGNALQSPADFKYFVLVECNAFLLRGTDPTENAAVLCLEQKLIISACA